MLKPSSKFLQILLKIWSLLSASKDTYFVSYKQAKDYFDGLKDGEYDKYEIVVFWKFIDKKPRMIQYTTIKVIAIY